MKTRHILLLLLLPALLCLSFDKKSSMLNQPMLSLPNKTLDGKVIDDNYYKGHVTIVCFMYIGCPPCMNEISTLNKIKYNYSSNSEVQVLCIARQMRQQMIDFNSNSKTLFSNIRRKMNADSITYTIQPACDDAQSKMDTIINGTDTITRIKSECNVIEETFGFSAYPTTFYIDKKGIVKKIATGAPDAKNVPEYYDEIKKEIDLLLAE